MIRLLYRVFTDLSAVPLRGWLKARAHRGKEVPQRLPERRGIASAPRPVGRLAWLHGASVGEALSLLPIIEGVRAAGWQVLITTGTVTSAALLKERLTDGCVHQFVPLDRTAWVRRFLDHWRPDLVLWSESELWPNTLNEIGRRKTPAVLLNARLSDKAYRGWRRWSGFAKAVLTPFDLVLAQSRLDADRFAALGAREVRTLGNIKLAAPPLPADERALAALREDIAGRPVWCAASIHPGEDAIVGQVARMLKDEIPGLLSVVVPRHPDKGRTMAETLSGLRCRLRSDSKAIARDIEVYIADTMGELGLFFRLCETVFMGKSLAVGGGQNPAEPALIGCALILGPDMSNFRETTAELLDTGAAVQVADAVALADAVRRLLGSPETRREMAAAGQSVMRRHSGAIKDTLAALSPYLAGREFS
ncbi:MAG: 3-deoxy-D-manno-octulosonic acid transferase [Rhodospirillaceae bacterium]